MLIWGGGMFCFYADFPGVSSHVPSLWPLLLYLAWDFLCHEASLLTNHITLDIVSTLPNWGKKSQLKVKKKKMIGNVNTSKTQPFHNVNDIFFFYIDKYKLYIFKVIIHTHTLCEVITTIKFGNIFIISHS